MQIIYLDQNKWIELAKSLESPESYPAQYSLLKRLGESVDSGTLLIPLAASNIYETHKINDPKRRSYLAHMQCTLCKGKVFRGRYKRLEVEVTDFLAKQHEITLNGETKDWFISDVFLEAYLEATDERFPFPLSEHLLEAIRANPPRALMHYLMEGPDEERRAAIVKFTSGSNELRARIERRRTQHSGETMEMRRKIYSVLLTIDEIELILKFARKIGLNWRSVSDMGAHTARQLMEDVPVYHIERELALRLEALNRAVTENDFRDMQTFCTVTPYADIVVSENLFVNLAQQSKLGPKYSTQFATDILKLNEILDF